MGDRIARIEVYELRPEKDDFVIDESRLLCIITVGNGSGTFQFFDAAWEPVIRETFDAPSFSFVYGGTDPEGAHYDGAVTHPAWSREALESIVKHELSGLDMGAKIFYEE
jgi:hypothetical protein